MKEYVNIKYDDLIQSRENAWSIKIADKLYHLPFSMCILDEKSKVLLCPLWLILDKQLEKYIDE